eukprot:2675148-Pyramimonas_sp.AAC.1
MDQSDAGDAGIFSRWTNQMQVTRVYSHDGPIKVVGSLAVGALAPPAVRSGPRLLLYFQCVQGEGAERDDKRPREGSNQPCGAHRAR